MRDEDVLFKRTIARGTFNIVFFLKFSDDVEWVMRMPSIPENAADGARLADKLESEYRTMQYLRNHCNVNIPETYGWMTNPNNPNNPVGCRFAFTVMVPGQSLFSVWYSEEFSMEQRCEIVKQVAKELAELCNHSFTATVTFISMNQVMLIG